MVGKLNRYKKDPNNKRRGAGLYYHRGNGVYSKYSEVLDAMKFVNKSIPKKTGFLTIPLAQQGAPHMADYNTKDRKSKTSRLPGGKVKGFF